MKKIAIFLTVAALMFPFTAHAFDYQQCMNKANAYGPEEMAKCKRSQMLEDLRGLQSIYDTLAKDTDLKVMNRNEIKKMYDNWISYRDAYCTLYAAANTDYYPEAYSKEHCLQEHTKNAYLYMRALVDLFYNDPD